jgi:obg-like ATPase 1
MYPAYLQVTDIAGLIKGASQGEGLGNAFLSHIQAVDGMYHIVRAFDNDEVLHVDDSIDPVRDLSKFLCLSMSLLEVAMAIDTGEGWAREWV